MEKLLLTIDEAASMLGIGYMASRKLLNEGGLPTIRIGRRIYVNRNALMAFIGEQTEDKGGDEERGD